MDVGVPVRLTRSRRPAVSRADSVRKTRTSSSASRPRPTNVLFGFGTADEPSSLRFARILRWFQPSTSLRRSWTIRTIRPCRTTNAISDVYAIGTPISTLNIVAFPKASISRSSRAFSRRRGRSARGRLTIFGGHTINDDERSTGSPCPRRSSAPHRHRRGREARRRARAHRPIGTGI